MEILAKSSKIDRFDILNMQSSKAFKDVNEAFEVRAAMIALDGENGRQYAYLIAENGDAYAGNSSNVLSAVSNLIDILDETGENVMVEFIHGTSKGGKDFITPKFSRVIK